MNRTPARAAPSGENERSSRSKPLPQPTSSGAILALAKKCSTANRGAVSRAAVHGPDSRSMAVCMAPRITVSSSSATATPEPKPIRKMRAKFARVGAKSGLHDAQVSRQQKRRAHAGGGDADRSPRAAHLEKSAPGQAVAEIARAREIQVPAQPHELRDQHQHGNAAGDAMKCPTREGRGQFIGGIGEQRADHAREQDRADEPCEGAHS